MFHKIPTIIVISLITIFVFIIMFYPKSNMNNKKSFKDLKDREMAGIVINGKKLNVEIVNSSESTKQGLSDRDEIGSDGMLFIFPEKNNRNFWMYNMKFDLDFVWINDSQVVGITKSVKKPQPGTKTNDLKLVSTDELTDKVLELNVGDIEKYGIKVGDTISLEDYDSNK